jgi:hypothetical protein
LEWLTDSLTAAAENAAAEGASFSGDSLSPRTRLNNYTQIMDKMIDVSATQIAINAAGIKEEFTYQLQKAEKELARDVELNVLYESSAAGTSGSPTRKMQGLVPSITSNSASASAFTGISADATAVVDLMEDAYLGGGTPNMIFVAPELVVNMEKAFYALLGTAYTKTEGGKVDASINVIQTPFGRASVEVARYLSASLDSITGTAVDSILGLDMDTWKLAFLRPFKIEDEVKDGADAKKRPIRGELTLEARNENANWKYQVTDGT